MYSKNLFIKKNKACYPICKLLNTIYELYVDKQELYIYIYVTYVTILRAFYILLNSLNDTSKGILFHFQN